MSGYTLEEMPSLQACKDEGILVPTRGTLSLYFALDTLPKLAMSAIDDEDYALSPEETAEAAERFKMLTAERVESYRCFVRGRDDFYNIQSYKHCPSCLGLFNFKVCGMETDCGHFLCDSCICRFRGGAEVFNGTFPYFCCERLDDGTECKANIDLAFMDPQSGLYHWRSAGFVAFQENSCRPCEVDESDSRFPVSPNAVIDVEDVVVAKNPSKRPIVSFRSRDSFVTVSGFSQNGLYLFRVVNLLQFAYTGFRKWNSRLIQTTPIPTQRSHVEQRRAKKRMLEHQ